MCNPAARKRVSALGPGSLLRQGNFWGLRIVKRQIIPKQIIDGGKCLV